MMMKTNDLLTIATAALGTAALTVAAFWAGPLDAGGDADAPTPMITKTRFIWHGVEFGLSPVGGRTFHAGDQPAFELTAHNTTQQATNSSVCVTLSASSPADANSRVERLPSVLWRQEQIVLLGPNETRVFALCASTNLPAKSVISVVLQEPGQRFPFTPGAVVALSFSTTNTPSPVVAAAR
jgi:hypothetical protein